LLSILYLHSLQLITGDTFAFQILYKILGKIMFSVPPSAVLFQNLSDWQKSSHTPFRIIQCLSFRHVLQQFIHCAPAFVFLFFRQTFKLLLVDFSISFV